jgi:hypothetical protein
MISDEAGSPRQPTDSPSRRLSKRQGDYYFQLAHEDGYLKLHIIGEPLTLGMLVSMPLSLKELDALYQLLADWQDGVDVAGAD